MKIIVLLLVLVFAFVVLRKSMAQEITIKNDSIYDFTLKDIDGNDQSLAVYKGKVLLIVNTASRCGFTPQYKGLEALYQQYQSKEFEVLGFPANNFMGQEPGSNEEIKKFCELRYKTTFPMFSKIDVRGPNINPLYVYLTQASGFNGDITWNFNKFLVDRTGQVVARFDKHVEPLDPQIVTALNQALGT